MSVETLRSGFCQSGSGRRYLRCLCVAEPYLSKRDSSESCRQETEAAQPQQKLSRADTGPGGPFWWGDDSMARNEARTGPDGRTPAGRFQGRTRRSRKSPKSGRMCADVCGCVRVCAGKCAEVRGSVRPLCADVCGCVRVCAGVRGVCAEVRGCARGVCGSARVCAGCARMRAEARGVRGSARKCAELCGTVRFRVFG